MLDPTPARTLVGRLVRRPARRAPVHERPPPIRPATVAIALRELHATGLAAVDVDDQDELAGRWSALPVASDPLLQAVDLHGAHDLRHTFATWLEDAGIPARVIDELMGHEASGRGGQHRGAVQQRLTVVLQVAVQAAEDHPY
jgi:hypothetical protein